MWQIVGPSTQWPPFEPFSSLYGSALLFNSAVVEYRILLCGGGVHVRRTYLDILRWKRNQILLKSSIYKKPPPPRFARLFPLRLHKRSSDLGDEGQARGRKRNRSDWKILRNKFWKMWDIWKSTSRTSQHVDKTLRAVEGAHGPKFVTRKKVRAQGFHQGSEDEVCMWRGSVANKGSARLEKDFMLRKHSVLAQIKKNKWIFLVFKDKQGTLYFLWMWLIQWVVFF